MIDCDVIMPVTNQNNGLFELNKKALLSFKASCDARIIFLGNNDNGSICENRFRDLALSNGYRYLYIHGKFNMSEFFNIGRKITSGKYVAYSNADVTFYPGWLDNLIELWNENPKYYSMHPYSFHPIHKGLCYRNDECSPIRKVVDCDHPGGSGITVMKREDNHVWDESFSYWEQDSDYWKWMKANGKMAGICYNSRVDHKIEGVMDLIGDSNLKDEKERASRIYKEKWEA